MLQKEFESLTGKKLTAEEYAYIEKIYMYVDMDKQDFCAAVKKNNFEELTAHLVKRAEQLEEARDKYYLKVNDLLDDAKDAVYLLLKAASEYKREDMKKAAITLVGMKSVVLIDMEKGFELNNEERAYIIKMLYAK